MRIMTFNCNGIRAAARKGFFDWLPESNADVICLQETKAQIDQLSDPVFHPEGYDCYYFDAEKKGYSGTAMFCRRKPAKVSKGLGFEIADSEGRYLQADYEGLSIVSLYLPSGSSGEERQARKMKFLDFFGEHLRKLRRKLLDHIIDAQQILFRILELQFCLMAALIQPRDPGRLFEHPTARFGFGVDQLGDLTLPHQRGRMRTG